MKNKKRILFVCKRRYDYGENPESSPSFAKVSYGLVNSASFVCNALETIGVEAKTVSVIDNNSIEKEIVKYNPTHCIIEAIWCVPSKFDVLLSKYPNIKWMVRVHSKIPFIANEGIAINWLKEYDDISKAYGNFCVTANNLEIIKALKLAFNMQIEYLPNIYCPRDYGHCEEEEEKEKSEFYNIGCFGAIRPMKNTLIQGLAAISFGNLMNLKIRFHINNNRLEQRGEPVLNNLIAVFENTPHELVCHPWKSHKDFIKLVKKMDLILQVSMSESFCIVAADAAWNRIPIVVSPEIEWTSDISQADPSNIEDIIKHMKRAYSWGFYNLKRLNLHLLDDYNSASLKVWKKFLKV